MKPTVRHRILAYLAKQPGSTAAQIGRSLNLSQPAVRHHLAVLKMDGRIASVGHDRHPGRGRPAATFRISARLAGDNLAAIATSLLDGWPGRSRPAVAHRLIAILAKSLLQQRVPLAQNVPPVTRIASLVERLNAANYRARWEAGADGPRIFFGHCPYAAIIERHPMLCAADARLLSEQTGRQAVQLAKIDFAGGTASQCIFAVK